MRKPILKTVYSGLPGAENDIRYCCIHDGFAGRGRREKVKQNDRRAAAAVIAAGILWGCINIFVKRLSAAGFGSLQISFVRMFTAALCFTLLLFFTDRDSLKIRPGDVWMFIGSGILSVAMMNILYFYTVINGEASVAVVLLYTSPVFIMLLSALIFKEKITIAKIAALVLTVTGCIFVTGLAGSGPVSVRPAVLLTGVLSGLAYGLYTIFGRFALKKYSSRTVTAWSFIFGFIGLIPFGRITASAEAVAGDPVLLLWCFGIGIVSTVLPFCLYTWGLERMESGRAAVLAAVEPVVGAALGMLVYKESVSWMKLAGIVLIITAIVILSRPEKKSMVQN